MPRVVIDTNVVLEGLTKQGGAAGLIMEAWNAKLLKSCVSNALAYEYFDVLSRRLSTDRWHRLRPVLKKLLGYSDSVAIYFTWRPSSPDPADEHVIDCAMNAGAIVVTSNIRDFKQAQQALGLPVMKPDEFVTYLAERE